MIHLFVEQHCVQERLTIDWSLLLLLLRDPSKLSPSFLVRVEHTLTLTQTKTATDIHMIGAFRQTLGIPDDMLPDAWRRTAVDQTQSYDGSHTTDDACARNPYRQQQEQEQHQQEHQLQHQHQNQLQQNGHRRVRHVGSRFRGR